MQLEIIQRFRNIYKGNPFSYNSYNNRTKRYVRIKKCTTEEVFKKHLESEHDGIGTIPVLDNVKSAFGLLDYDNHTKTDGIDLIALEKRIRKIKAPLVVCRSKSGGAHVYLFGQKELNTRVLRQTLANYASKLTGFGETDIEIFPRQESVDKNKSGNAINLPYLNALKTDRYCIHKGKKLAIRDFLNLAEENAVDNVRLVELGSSMYNEAPPCIESLAKEVLGKGRRNVALYNYLIYLKKAYPDSIETLAFKYNAENFEEPLDPVEVTQAIANIKTNSQYKYKCSEEPCKSRCDSAKCVLRKFGITASERSDVMLSELPEFGQLRKYLTNPVQYELDIEGKTLRLRSDDILRPSNFVKVVFEQLDRVVKIPKAEVWREIVDRLIQTVEVIEVPDDASRDGIIRSMLLEFLKNADLKSEGTDRTKRMRLLTGMPVVQKMKGKKYIFFVFKYFLRYLQSQRIGAIAQNEVYMAVKQFEVEYKNCRVQGHGQVKVWAVPMQKEHEIELDTTDVTSIDMPEAPSDKISQIAVESAMPAKKTRTTLVDAKTFKPEF